MAKKVLVLDDVPDTVEVVKLVLESNKFEVLSYTDPKKALADIKKKKPKIDLMLVDLMMPDMTGLEFADEARKIKELEKVPVALFTASADADKGMIKKHNIKGMIYKPFDVNDLIVKIKQFIK